MNCPRCGNRLELSNAKKVEIDFCPNCRGVWLDRGELEKIIERSDAFSAQTRMPEQNSWNYPENHHRHDDHDNHHDSHRNYDHHSQKKKGFLSDLFDF